MPPKAAKDPANKSSRSPAKKGRGAVVKRTPTKRVASESGPANSNHAACDRNLLFLWDVMQHSGSSITLDQDAISKKYGLTHGATQKRWFRLKKKLEAMEAAQKQENVDDAEDHDEQDVQDEQDVKEEHDVKDEHDDEAAMDSST